MDENIDDAVDASPEDAAGYENVGFEPAVSVTGADRPGTAGAPTNGKATKSGSRRPVGESTRPRTRRLVTRPGLRRRLGALAVLGGALAVMGTSYATFAGSSGAAATGMSAQDIAAGHQLYQNSCITCHGANLDGVNGQGPSLIGVGSAATYFQVVTGRMPLAGQGAYSVRKTARFNETQTEQIAAYVESVGGGPQLPTGNLQAGANELGAGGELYRLNCASCHGVTLKGAPLAAGASAPSLNDSTDKVIWAAMLSGPENMPVFGDNQITPTEKQRIVAYIRTLQATADPGGAGVDRIGPVSEAIVIWVGGVGALMIAILWIGAKVR